MKPATGKRARPVTVKLMPAIPRYLFLPRRVIRSPTPTPTSPARPAPSSASRWPMRGSRPSLRLPAVCMNFSSRGKSTPRPSAPKVCSSR